MDRKQIKKLKSNDDCSDWILWVNSGSVANHNSLEPQDRKILKEMYYEKENIVLWLAMFAKGEAEGSVFVCFCALGV